MSDAKKGQVNVTLPLDIYKAVAKEAKAARIAVSARIRQIVAEYFGK